MTQSSLLRGQKLMKLVLMFSPFPRSTNRKKGKNKYSSLCCDLFSATSVLLPTSGSNFLFVASLPKKKLTDQRTIKSFKKLSAIETWDVMILCITRQSLLFEIAFDKCKWHYDETNNFSHSKLRSFECGNCFTCKLICFVACRAMKLKLLFHNFL